MCFSGLWTRTHSSTSTLSSAYWCIVVSLADIFSLQTHTRHWPPFATSSAGMIIAGYDPLHGGSVYSIPLGGSLHKQSYAIGGSGSTYIYGYCDAYWKEGMSEAEGIGFVKGALREAIKWDGSSGGVIRLVVLTAKGAVRHLYLPDQEYKGPGRAWFD